MQKSSLMYDGKKRTRKERIKGHEVYYLVLLEAVRASTARDCPLEQLYTRNARWLANLEGQHTWVDTHVIKKRQSCSHVQAITIVCSKSAPSPSAHRNKDPRVSASWYQFVILGQVDAS